MKKLTTTLLVIITVAAANAFAFAGGNGGAADKAPVRTAAGSKEKQAPIDLATLTTAPRVKAFDPTAAKSTMSEYNAQKKAAKKFSTTTKVLIGLGIAAAVVAIVVVAAKDDLKDDILQ